MPSVVHVIWIHFHVTERQLGPIIARECVTHLAAGRRAALLANVVVGASFAHNGRQGAYWVQQQCVGMLCCFLVRCVGSCVACFGHGVTWAKLAVDSAVGLVHCTVGYQVLALPVHCTNAFDRRSSFVATSHPSQYRCTQDFTMEGAQVVRSRPGDVGMEVLQCGLGPGKEVWGRNWSKMWNYCTILTFSCI